MKNVIKRVLLGISLGEVLTPATTQAQWTVFDPAQYALQIERQIEEANRWLERVKQYTDEINKMVEQITTMKGVLTQAEKLVLHNANLTRTMAQIGQTVRDVFALKRSMETMVISRLNMVKSIKSSLASGIFDPEADLRDFEDYLRNSIGRTAQDKIATMNRISDYPANDHSGSLTFTRRKLGLTLRATFATLTSARLLKLAISWLELSAIFI